jgi:hypothetical protein
VNQRYEHVHFIYKINGHLKIKYLAQIENRVPIQAQMLDDHKQTKLATILKNSTSFGVRGKI